MPVLFDLLMRVLGHPHWNLGGSTAFHTTVSETAATTHTHLQPDLRSTIFGTYLSTQDINSGRDCSNSRTQVRLDFVNTILRHRGPHCSQNQWNTAPVQ